MDTELEFQDSPELDEAPAVQEPEPQAQPETPPVDVAAIEQKNKELYARAKKAEDELKALKAQPQPENKSTNPPVQDDRLDRLALKVDGYSDAEIDYVFSLGGPKVLDNPIIKKAIEQLRAEEKSKNASPEGTGKSPIYKRHTLQELQNMSVEELEKILPHSN